MPMRQRHAPLPQEGTRDSLPSHFGTPARFRCWYDSVNESGGSIFLRWRFTLPRRCFGHSDGRGHTVTSTPMAEDNSKYCTVAGTCDGNNGVSASRLAGRGDLCGDLPLVVLHLEDFPLQPRITRPAIRVGNGFDRAAGKSLRVGAFAPTDADDPSGTGRPFGGCR